MQEVTSWEDPRRHMSLGERPSGPALGDRPCAAALPHVGADVYPTASPEACSSATSASSSGASFPDAGSRARKPPPKVQSLSLLADALQRQVSKEGGMAPFGHTSSPLDGRCCYASEPGRDKDNARGVRRVSLSEPPAAAQADRAAAAAGGVLEEPRLPAEEESPSAAGASGASTLPAAAAAAAGALPAEEARSAAADREAKADPARLLAGLPGDGDRVLEPGFGYYESDFLSQNRGMCGVGKCVCQ
eukprot:TRINITY_DN20028_c0_g1_i1.p1 TRINITY_DN20028_c0_g1~~TRINITY_DN20028_c0_g1_i1.p1  ORF type:complete len:247 (-),score=45.06 TRINITY_DN20028_c0_g1_i1:47-787(-)